MFVIIRVTSAPIAAVIVCLVLAWISTEPQAERLDQVYYMSFQENFILPLVFAVPIYLILGLPYSLLIDRLFEHVQLNRYAKEILAMCLYMVGGAFAMFLFIFTIEGGMSGHMIGSMLYLLGSISALVYYVVIRSFAALWTVQLRRREREAR